jgi:hypothetical protein
MIANLGRLACVWRYQPLCDILRHGASLRQAGFAEIVEPQFDVSLARRADDEPPEDPDPAMSTTEPMAETLAEIGETVRSAAEIPATRVGGDALSSSDDDLGQAEEAPVRA